MSDSDAFIALPAADPARLAAAIQAVATEDHQRAAWLRAGAEQSKADAPSDPVVARRFQTVLELAYLVASADGLDPAERASLSRLLESMTDNALDHATLELHFADLDAAVAALGRHERLARAAADIGPEAREDAIGLAALIAVGDGALSNVELAALVELGTHLGLGDDRVRDLVRTFTARVQERLR